MVNLKGKEASLDFLGYTYRYDRDLYGRAQRYRNVIPSKKALQREREQLRAMTNVTQSHKPLARLIAELNRHLKGWGNYNLVRIPTGGLRADQQQRLFYHLRRQPATLPTAGRGELQRPMGPAWASSCCPAPALSASARLRLHGFRRMREICTSGSTRGEWAVPLAGGHLLSSSTSTRCFTSAVRLRCRSA